MNFVFVGEGADAASPAVEGEGLDDSLLPPQPTPAQANAKTMTSAAG
jgi:hypothetical protein